MTPEDRDAIVAFGASQPVRDRAFLRINIADPEVVDGWIENINRGRTVTVLVEGKNGLLGYGSLHHNEVLWTSHMAELRVFVGSEIRGKGIGERLFTELFHVAKEMRLERVVCQVPAEQGRVRVMLEHLGFQPEAVLNEWIHTPDGDLHDLMILSKYLRAFGA
jgi:L-amino acid N-acyltransferase YncA